MIRQYSFKELMRILKLPMVPIVKQGERYFFAQIVE